MSGEDDGDITVLLRRWREGSSDAENELFRLVTPDLQKLARHFMRLERLGHTLASSDLVDEIYIRLVAARNRDWQSRRHFFAIAARAMRRYLIDYARNRGKAQFVPFPEIEAAISAGSSKIELALTIDKVLDELEKVEPELCSLVELKFFLSPTDQEAADALGLKLRTFQRMWQDAREWLFQRLGAKV
jgi:RNA polymerase sigma-70 factor (ECF subfamily)